MEGHGSVRVRSFLLALLLAYCAKQVLIVVLFPPFTGHDEVAHYEYIRILALDRRLPTLSTDRLPARLYEYRDYALQWRDLGQSSTPLYTAVHPPLYYAAMVPVYRLGRDLQPVGKQYLLRFAAIPFGLLVVLLAYRLTSLVFPDDRALLVTVPTVVAFQPQVSYEAAMVNNDIVAIAAFSGLFCLLVQVIRHGLTFGRALMVGLIFGLGLLAKTTVAAALPVMLLAFWFGRQGSSQRAIGALTAVAGVALVILSPWYAFMYRTYGDFTGLSELSTIQTTLTRSDLSFLQLAFSGEFAMTRWRETWGEFGWRLIPLNGDALTILALLGLLAAFGFSARTLLADPSAGASGEQRLERWQKQALLVLTLACGLAYLAVVQFGTAFMLAQARYYFPAVNAAALLGLYGLKAWVAPRWDWAFMMAVVLGAVLLNVLIYTAHVVPYWHFRA